MYAAINPNGTTPRDQGRSYGGYIGIYTPQNHNNNMQQQNNNIAYIRYDMLLPHTLGEIGHVGGKSTHRCLDSRDLLHSKPVNENEKYYLHCQLFLFMYLFIEQKLLALSKLGALLSLLLPKYFKISIVKIMAAVEVLLKLTVTVVVTEKTEN